MIPQQHEIQPGELAYIQALRFANRFNLSDLRLVEGCWWADDDGEPYRISSENYYAAIEEGDL